MRVLRAKPTTNVFDGLVRMPLLDTQHFGVRGSVGDPGCCAI